MKQQNIFFFGIILFLISHTLYAQNTVTITYSNTGNFQFTMPSTATSATGTAIGGGGGGGGAKVRGYKGIGNYVAGAAAGGGGAGCTATNTLFANTNYNITVGQGGSGGNASNINCGTSTVSNQKTSGNGTASSIGSVITANGGTGAYDIYTYSKGIGDQGGYTSAGGAGCSSGENGNSGTMDYASWNDDAPQNVRGGKGGGNVSENGGGPLSSTHGSGNGKPGSAAGAGGGGGAARSTGNECTTGNGGNGANGQITITFVLPKPVLNIVSSPVCEGEELHFYINNPETAQTCSYRLLLNGTMIAELNSVNSYHFIIHSVASNYAGIYSAIADYTIAAPNSTTPNIVCSVQSDNYSVSVTSKQVAPVVQWGYDNICVMDESFEDDTVAGYFANHIEWDSIVWQAGLDLTRLIWYDAAIGGNILKQNGMLTTAGTALQLQGKFIDFDQSQPHAREVYWVSIAASAGYCESDRTLIPVEISNTEININDICIACYTKLTSDKMAWDEIVIQNSITIDNAYQGLWWFSNATTAQTAYSNKNNVGSITPDSVDMANPLPETSYWAIRYDEVDGSISCLSKPFKVTATVFPHPHATLRAANGQLLDTICAGESISLVFHFTAGIPPFYFTGYSGTIYMVTAADLDANRDYHYTLPNNIGSTVFQILEMSDSNRSAYSCFVYEEEDYSFSDIVSITRYSSPSNIRQITAPGAICKGEALIFPPAPTFTSNSDNLYTVGWLLNDVEIAAGYIPTIADNGKKLKYFVSNECGTVYSNEQNILIYTEPQFSPSNSRDTVKICEGNNLNTLSLPSINENGYTITSWTWLLNGDTLLHNTGSSSGGSGGTNCEIIGSDYWYYNTAYDVSGKNITVTDFNNSYFTGVIDRIDDCDHNIIAPGASLAFLGGSSCSPSVTAVRWYNISEITSTAEFPITATYGTHIFPLGINPCLDMGTGGIVNMQPQNFFNQKGWIYADNNGLLTKITTAYAPQVPMMPSIWYENLVLVDASCSGGGGTGVDPLELPDYTVKNSDDGKALVLVVENTCGESKDTMILDVLPLPTVIVNDTEICQDGSISLTFTGIPPFELEYTVDKQGVGTGLTPATYGFPTQFSNGANGVDNWMSLGNNTYTCTIIPNSPGKYTLNITKITDKNCENK